MQPDEWHDPGKLGGQSPVGVVHSDPAAIELHSPLPLGEARARLKQRVIRPWRLAYVRTWPRLVGFVGNDRLNLGIGDRRNPFRKRFLGRLAEDGEGTRID